MQKTEFLNWLKDVGIQSASTYIGKVKRIEDYHGNIDEAYDTDNCQKLLSLFKYSRNDVKNKKQLLHKIPINPTSDKDIYESWYEGTQDYFTRINKYIEFRKSAGTDVPKKQIEYQPLLNTQSAISSQKIPLNRIFYGPPGTGKTYHTINAALEILVPEKVKELKNIKDEEERRKAQKEAFNELLEMGKISFVTFHQSFSYEDFVEGIRPDVAEEDNDKENSLAYNITSGIFKEICEAADARTIDLISENMDLTDRKIWKMSLGDSYKDKAVYDYCIENNTVLMGYGGSHDFTNAISRDDIHNQLVNEERTNDLITGMVYNFTKKMQKRDILIVSEGLTKIRAIAEVTGDYAYLADEILNHKGHAYKQSRPVRWLCQFSPSMPLTSLQEKRFSQLTVYSLTLNDKGLHSLQTIISPPKNNLPNNHVLIIDEINRGNISGIFGELITLIEPSKRLGAAEELKVTLPYSRDTFGVPNNLYIIGTMNTADRSLTGLDIALRRRFTFIEMPPDDGLLKNKKLEGTDTTVANLLLAMNERIEFLLGRDYCLGHAAFMHLKDDVYVTVKDLKPIFKNTIIPLLQEYFFEDWRKIHLVLNDHKKDEQFRFIKEKTTSLGLLNDEEFSKSPRRLWEINKGAFKELASYVGIVNPT